MKWHLNHRIERFCVVGVSYQKADTAIRSRFSLDEKASERLLAEAKNRGLTSVLILSTCNRVEVYGFAPQAEILVELLINQCPDAHADLFNHYGYRLNGLEALKHVFRVGAGLESQILGDFEIVGQLKQSLKMASANNMVGPLMNRILSFVLQASKKIKNETALSKGTASVSFAVVEWLKQQMDTAGAKILLIGAGSFGKTVLKNIKEYCPGAQLSLTNRTPSKALELCRHLEIQYVSFEILPVVLNDFDVVICCTNAPAPFIDKSFFMPGKMRRIIDLSVPANVHAGVKELAATRVINVDEISNLVNSTLNLRLGEVPKANNIIEEQLDAFIQWLDNDQHAAALAGFKQNLLTIKDLIPFEKVNASEVNFTSGPAMETGINKRAGQLMKKFKNYHNKGCQMILAYDNFIRSQMVLTAHD